MVRLWRAVRNVPMLYLAKTVIEMDKRNAGAPRAGSHQDDDGPRPRRKSG